MSDMCPTTAKVMDLFYANPGQEPDWEAIYFALSESYHSPYQVEMEILRLVHEVYEA